MVTIPLVFALFAMASGQGHTGTDRPYGDLPGMPQAAPTAAACEAMCQTTVGCKAWAFGIVERLCWLKQNVTKLKLNADRVSGVSDTSLVPFEVSPVDIGFIKPKGWLLRQSHIQAESLSGHLALFWKDVWQSIWIGGSGDGGLHERTPYWLNGIVPLAFQIEDSNITTQMNYYINYILTHVNSNGWIGPNDVNDYWSHIHILLVLVNYHQGNQSDTRVLPILYRHLNVFFEKLMVVPLFGWGAARYQDAIVAVQWLMDRYSQNRQLLWDLCEVLHRQGMDWKSWFTPSTNRFPKGEVTSGFNLFTHGVNNGQAIKTGAVVFRMTNDYSDRDYSDTAIQLLDQFHGQANGMFSCDEHLAGLMPSHGTELCTVVETMYSIEVMYQITGDLSKIDRLERLAYNALPAEMLPDMWAHQYLQQVNGVDSKVDNPHLWITDGPDSILFGLEPNFGCCTANFNQGWPKFVQSIFSVDSYDETTVYVGVWAPAELQHPTYAGGVNVTVTTDYPFSDSATVTAVGKEDFGLCMRVPQFAESALFEWSVNGSSWENQTSPNYRYFCLSVSALDRIAVKVEFKMEFKFERRFNNSLSIYRGPLLFALRLGEEFTQLKHYAYNSSDWQILPTSPWNIALIWDDTNPLANFEYVNTGKVDSHLPFNPKTPPVYLKAKGRRIPQWGMQNSTAASPPLSPVSETDSEIVDVILLPYGSSNIRVAEIPTTLK